MIIIHLEIFKLFKKKIIHLDSDVARSVLSNSSLYNIPQSKLKLPSFSQQYLSPNINLPGIYIIIIIEYKILILYLTTSTE